jgi:hypothetical protein
MTNPATGKTRTAEQKRTLHLATLLHGETRALTVRQPWTFTIAEGFKPTENRTRRTHYRGQILLHSGRTVDDFAPIAKLSRSAAARLDELGGRGNFWDAQRTVPSRFASNPPSLALSAIVAVAALTGCHRDSDCCAPWGERGVFHWTLSDVVALPEAVPCPGRLGLWRPDREAFAAVAAQLRGSES